MKIQDFLNAKFERRTEFIPVPELKQFFAEDIQAEITRQGLNPETITSFEALEIEKTIVGFRVQSLTGLEYGEAEKMAQDRKNLAAIAEGFLSGISKDIIDSIKKMYGLEPGAEVAPGDALNMYLFMRGVVEPEIRQDQKLELAVKLYKFFPVDFRHICRKIQILTGMGHIPGELHASLQTKG